MLKFHEVIGESADLRLAVLVPVYNEAKLLSSSLDGVLAAAATHGWQLELIVVDDGSTDGTSDVLRRYQAAHADWCIHVMSHESNRGKGAAIRSGLAAVTAPIAVCHDADLEYDPGDLNQMLCAIAGDDVDVVYGSRCLQDSINPRRWNLFAFGVSALTLATRMLYGFQVTDEATCYKMFRTEDLRRMDLECERFEFCPEVTAKAARLGLKLAEVPITYRPRSTEEGKKIRFQDGWEALQTLWALRNWKPATMNDHEQRFDESEVSRHSAPHVRSNDPHLRSNETATLSQGQEYESLF